LSNQYLRNATDFDFHVLRGIKEFTGMNARVNIPDGLCRFLGVILIPVLIGFLPGCDHSVREPVTITFMDPEWSHDRSRRSVLWEENLREFEKETGITVKHLPAPETSMQQLDLVQQLIGSERAAPDVYGIDVIWAGLLSEDLLDLKPFFTSELSREDSEVVAGYTVKGKLIAVPYHTHVGVLMYRTDLLKKYGYHAPPQTWDELERMAFRIQQGERAAGDKEFWGFAWPGAADEGLTCLGLEWQMSEGGGRIIEANRTVSVNNPSVVRAWQRAAHWVGWISPPSVTSYEEWDAANLFENTGQAAFRLAWISDYFLANHVKTATYGKEGITSVPAGRMPSVATLGGFGLGVSRRSEHQSEAIAFVRFLLHKESDLEASRAKAELPAVVELYRLPTILKAYSASLPAGRAQGAAIVSRPSTVTGKNYEIVSRRYAAAVHSVLTGKKSAPQAAGDLETELEQITGFTKAQNEPTQVGISRLKSSTIYRCGSLRECPDLADNGTVP
jgi:trehalose/maltose transport system substrate-binding protein